MENNPMNVDKPLDTNQIPADLPEIEPEESGYVIRRPKRAKLTAMENFIAAVRRSKG